MTCDEAGEGIAVAGRRQGGFTLVELLVAVTVFLLMYAGVHGLFSSTWTAWRRGNTRLPLYEVGVGLTDSIMRDARPAKNMTGTSPGTQQTTGGITYGNNFTLVLNYPSRRNSFGRYDQKRVTYWNDPSGRGFMRRVEQDQTTGPTGAISTGSPYYQNKEWVLTKYVSNFQFEYWNYFGTYPRYLRFYLNLDPQGLAAYPNYQYRIYGLVALRRNDADVPDAVSY